MHLAAAPSPRLAPPLPSSLLSLCQQVLPTIWHIYHSTNIYGCRWRRDSAGSAEAEGVAEEGTRWLQLSAGSIALVPVCRCVCVCARVCVKPLEIQPQVLSEKCLKKQHFLGIIAIFVEVSHELNWNLLYKDILHVQYTWLYLTIYYKSIKIIEMLQVPIDFVAIKNQVTSKSKVSLMSVVVARFRLHLLLLLLLLSLWPSGVNIICIFTSKTSTLTSKTFIATNWPWRSSCSCWCCCCSQAIKRARTSSLQLLLVLLLMLQLLLPLLLLCVYITLNYILNIESMMLLTFFTPQFTCTVGRRACIQLVVCLPVSFTFPWSLSLYLSLYLSVCLSFVCCFTPAPLRWAQLILLSSCSCCTFSIEFCGCRYCCCLISLGLCHTRPRSRSASRQYSSLICLLHSERNSLHIDRGKCLCACIISQFW